MIIVKLITLDFTITDLKGKHVHFLKFKKQLFYEIQCNLFNSKTIKIKNFLVNLTPFKFIETPFLHSFVICKLFIRFTLRIALYLFNT